MRLTIILLTALCISQVNADDLQSSIGGKIGFNLGHFIGDDADINGTVTKMQPGLNVGVFANLALFNFFALQPEIQFTQKGEVVEANSDLASGEWDIQLSYLEIPLLAKLYLPIQAHTRPYVFAGPYIGFNLNAETDEIYNVGPFNFQADSNLEEEINPYEVGVSTGAGLAQYFDKIMLFIEFRYTIGLSKTFDNDTFDDVSTGTLAGQVGFGFNL